MKKILLSILAVAGAFSAYSAEISDYCGEYQANFISAFGNPEIQLFKITQSETAGKVIIDGLYAPPLSAHLPLRRTSTLRPVP